MSISQPTQSAQSKPSGPDLSVDKMIIAAVVALAIAALWYLFSQKQYALRASASGYDGLTHWLSAHGQSTQSFTGGWFIDQSTIGILVLPVFDTDLDVPRKTPKDEKEYIQQQDEYDLYSKPLTRKAERVPSLIILPKWRSGMRLTQKAHPVLTVEQTKLEKILKKITGEPQAKMSFSSADFVDFNYIATDQTRLKAQIYAPQTLSAKGCTPLVGNEINMLLADCPVTGKSNKRVLILSDPDLLNNHGLRLGQNAEIARDLLMDRAQKKNVVIDYSNGVWLHDRNTGIKRERSWEDLQRFFGPPFLTLWLAGALLFVLFLWRGWVRYGPIRSEETSLGAKKELAIDTRARLMRLSGQDGAMLNEYVNARLAAVATNLIGVSQTHQYTGEAGLMRFLWRRNPEQAENLKIAVTEIRSLAAHIPAAEAIRHVDEFEYLLEQIAHDT